MSDGKELLANIPPFGLRMQAELKERIKEAAEANNRSMNAEIVARLEKSLRGEEVDRPDSGSPRKGLLTSLTDTELEELLSGVRASLDESLDRERELAGKFDKLAEIVLNSAAASDQILDIVRGGLRDGKTDVGS